MDDKSYPDQDVVNNIVDQVLTQEGCGSDSDMVIAGMNYQRLRDAFLWQRTRSALEGLIKWAESDKVKSVEMSAWAHGVKYTEEDVAPWQIARDALSDAPRHELMARVKEELESARHNHNDACVNKSCDHMKDLDAILKLMGGK